MTPVPDILHPLFHNYAIESIDMENDWKFIIKTVMIGGNWEQWVWTARHYGLKKFEEVLREDLEGYQELPRPVANYWSVVIWNKTLPPLKKGERWRPTRKIPATGE